VRLPNADRAIIDRTKVVEYLLNPHHPDNGGKAQFFESLGFNVGTAEALIESLRSVAQTGEVVGQSESIHGRKYLADGVLPSYAGGTGPGFVRTVWIIDQGADAPRLVTAYPGRK
jgi:hypothetical protein